MKILTIQISIGHILEYILLVVVQNRSINYFVVAFSLSQRV